MKKGYSVENLKSAIVEAQAGESSVRAVAKKYGIPSSTLHDHVHDTSKQIGAGGPTVLQKSEEKEIAVACVSLAEMGFGITRELVEVVLFDYIKENDIPNPFNGGVPGRDWWQGFMRRWPMLSERKPQHLSLKRAQAGDKEIIGAWFDEVNAMLTKAGLDPEDPTIATRLWNCDETAFCTSVSSKKLIARRGMKVVHEIAGGSGRQYITVHCAGSANGGRLPPFILYKGKNMYQRWMQGGPAAVVYGISESGWMDSDNFLSWFKKMFLPAVSHLTKEAPVLLFFDGHYSHISMELIKLARSNNIEILCLPPNTTHLLQPLDVGVFAPLKSAWRGILKRYSVETGGAHVTKEIFPSLIAKLWEISFEPAHCKGGFRGTGLYPLSKEHVLEKLEHTSSKTKSASHPAATCGPAATSGPVASSGPAVTKKHVSTVKCTSCGHETEIATPTMKLCMKSYFAGILEVRKDKPKVGERNNLKVRIEGDVITSDEFTELLEEQKTTSKQSKQKKKSAKTPKVVEQPATGI